jgi:hypothetical protein
MISQFNTSNSPLDTLQKRVNTHKPQWSKRTYIIGAVSLAAIASVAYLFSRYGFAMPSSSIPHTPDITVPDSFPQIPDPISNQFICPTNQFQCHTNLFSELILHNFQNIKLNETAATATDIPGIPSFEGPSAGQYRISFNSSKSFSILENPLPKTDTDQIADQTSNTTNVGDARNDTLQCKNHDALQDRYNNALLCMNSHDHSMRSISLRALHDKPANHSTPELLAGGAFIAGGTILATSALLFKKIAGLFNASPQPRASGSPELDNPVQNPQERQSSLGGGQYPRILSVPPRVDLFGSGSSPSAVIFGQRANPPPVAAGSTPHGPSSIVKSVAGPDTAAAAETPGIARPTGRGAIPASVAAQSSRDATQGRATEATRTGRQGRRDKRPGNGTSFAHGRNRGYKNP